MNKAIERGVKKVVVHSFLDGRDVPPTSAKQYLTQLSEAREKGVELGVVCGRYYAMDRDRNYDRTQLAYNALVFGDAPVKGLLEGIDESYKEGITDEFVKPYIVTKGCTIEENDSVIFANFRPDRAIQISVALTNPKEATGEKGSLQRYVEFKNLCFVQMMLYSEKVKGEVAFGLQELDNMYGDVISNLGLKQLRIAETEKYAHVTYFFDGGVDKELKGADRILVPSPKVATYDLKPEMSAREITSNLLEKMDNNYDFIFLNFANGDMVGHTGNYDMTKKAIETIDEMIGKLYKKCVENGNVVTSHTTNLVPFIVTDKNLNIDNVNKLSDIAPFVLNYMNLNLPDEMK